MIDEAIKLRKTLFQNFTNTTMMDVRISVMH